MALDQDTINAQLELLAAHLRTLAHLVQQAAQFGGETFAPPQTANGIAEARGEIQRIKAVLREGDVEVDAPSDEAPPQTEPVQQAGGDVVMGDKIGGDEVIGDKRTIITQGGDYAEGNIDKRQGVFVSGGTIHGPVVGVNQGNITASYTLQQRPEPILHQLRAPVGDFVGREREIDQLVQALSKAATSGTAVSISGVRGMGGIGKTELAYVIGHWLRDTFPDAQLLIELRGASRSPLTPEQALQTVIRSFEREAKLPDDLAQLQGIYRSLMTGKKVLILADDAFDVGQVRPLLPPPGNALLVTSRNRFSLPRMQTIDLEVLSSADAEKLLLEVCPRMGEHAGELAKLCGYLPLALRVSASLLEANDDYDVEDYLKQLANERLQYLSSPDNTHNPQVSVEASLRLSYDTLGPVAQRVLCQLSVFQASFDREGAVEVVEVEGDTVEVLRLLRRRVLLEWDAALERYSLHDLVRAFGAVRLADGDGDGDAVRLRHARYYAGVAGQAKNLYFEGGTSLLTGLALFDRERVHIDAGWRWARERVSDPDADTLLLDYANASGYIGNLRYHKRRERIPQLEAALAAAQRLKNRGREGQSLGDLGIAYAMLGDARTAITFYEQALVIDRELGDRRRERQELGNLGNAYDALGDARTAITYHEQALVIARELGDRRGEGNALGNLGNAYFGLGDARTAITYHKQALVIDREIGNRHGEGNALGNLGNAYDALGDAHTAITYHEQALVIARELGDRRGEGNALGNLGIVYFGLGDVRTAITHHEQALVIDRELGDRRGEGQTLGSLGNAYFGLGDARTAITFYEQTLVIARELGDRRGEGQTLGNLGNAYFGLGDARTAITYHEQALMIDRETGDRLGEGITSWNLGEALEKQGDLARATDRMQTGVDLLREFEHPAAEESAAHLEQLRQRLAGGDDGKVAGEGA